MKKGFTLIEILVVVLIIGILASIALPQYNVAVAKSKASNAFTNMKSLISAQESFYLLHGRYTEDLEDLDLSFSDLKGIHCEGWGFCQIEDGSVIIEFNYPRQSTPNRTWASGVRFCIAKNESAKKACLSLEGSPISEDWGTGNSYYTLP